MKKKDYDEQEELRKEEIRRQNEAFTYEAFELFLKHYPPAGSINEATRFFSAEEISCAIKGLYPTADVDAYSVSLLLKESGYRYTALKDNFNLVMKWMVK